MKKFTEFVGEAKALKVPEKINIHSSDRLDKYFDRSYVQTIMQLVGTSRGATVFSKDGQEFTVGIGHRKNDGFGDGYFHFINMEKLRKPL